MFRKSLFFLVVVCCLWAACRDKEREKQLLQREQQLLEREQQLALKETEYQALIKMRDSILAQKAEDSIRVDSVLRIHWPDAIAGQWTSKVYCNESNCPDYLVGDQRTDTWEFGTDSAQLITKVINNNKLVRVYTATYDEDIIKLHFKTSDTANKQVEMNILLNDISPSKMKGIRVIQVDNKCTAKFTVDLSRIAQ